MSDIFLSYASEDRDRVTGIVAWFQREGWTVWWDRRILPGENWDGTIEDALSAARCVVVVWTERSVLSEWVRIEANFGRERAILVPVILDDVRIPVTFRHLQAASLSAWDGNESSPSLIPLRSGIRAVISAPPAASHSTKDSHVEERALDAAMRHEVSVNEATTLIAMLRCADSEGLTELLKADDEYDIFPEDVVSKPFDLLFPSDAAGNYVTAEILLRVLSPGFDPGSMEKKIRVTVGRNSTICSFLLTPTRCGNLVVQVEILQQGTCVASRVLRSRGVSKDQSPNQWYKVVSLPLAVRTSEVLAAATLPKPAPLPAATPAAQAGEFTRMFAKPPTDPTPEPPPTAPPPKPSGPGEFTRVLQSPMPSAPAQGDWPAPPPKHEQAGEFTRMFQSPQPEQPSSGGEFTRMFNTGRPSAPPGQQFPSPTALPPAQPQAAPPVAPSAPVEFTQMFGRPGAGAPASPTPQAPMQPGYGSGSGAAGSGATGAFRKPAPSAQPPDSTQQGPSEYTRMIQTPSAAPQGPQAPQGGAAPQAAQLKMPPMQMPPAPQMHVQPPPPMQMPQVSMASIKAPKMPTEVAVKAPGPNMLLIVIFCLLAFLVGALLIVLLLKK
jgi:hypothetical protein